MSVVKRTAGLAVLMDAAMEHGLPIPVKVTIDRLSLGLEFESIADVARWARFCNAEPSTHQDAEHSNVAILFFHAEPLGVPVMAWTPLPVKNPARLTVVS